MHCVTIAECWRHLRECGQSEHCEEPSDDRALEYAFFFKAGCWILYVISWRECLLGGSLGALRNGQVSTEAVPMAVGGANQKKKDRFPILQQGQNPLGALPEVWLGMCFRFLC